MSDQPTIDELIVDRVTAAVADAIERAEQRGEDRARALRTHLSVAEAAQSLGISERHCRTLVEDGTIPSFPLGRRVVVPRRALEELGMEGRGPVLNQSSGHQETVRTDEN